VDAGGEVVALGEQAEQRGDGLLVPPVERREELPPVLLSHRESLVRGLQDLAFLTGGVMHGVFLGLLVAGIAVPGWLVGLLPRPLAYAGLAIASIAELSTLSLVWQSMSFLLPVGRFPALLWLLAAGVLLPHK
jgi:hypothetical protein